MLRILTVWRCDMAVRQLHEARIAVRLGADVDAGTIAEAETMTEPIDAQTAA